MSVTNTSLIKGIKATHSHFTLAYQRWTHCMSPFIFLCAFVGAFFLRAIRLIHYLRHHCSVSFQNSKPLYSFPWVHKPTRDAHPRPSTSFWCCWSIDLSVIFFLTVYPGLTAFRRLILTSFAFFSSKFMVTSKHLPWHHLCPWTQTEFLVCGRHFWWV